MMKFLLVLAVLVIAYLVWRAGQVREAQGDAPGERDAARPKQLPQDMVRCPVCSVHLPRPEALPGASGRLYCSHEHRIAGGN